MKRKKGLVSTVRDNQEISRVHGQTKENTTIEFTAKTPLVGRKIFWQTHTEKHNKTIIVN